VAPDYNAVYNESVSVPGKFKRVGKATSASACMATCIAAGSACPIWAWSAASTACWWRLDAVWGSPETLHSEPGRVSGCRLGTNASSGAPLVAGCGKNPAPGPGPGPGPAAGKFWYGGQGNNIGDPRQSGAPASIIPVLTRIDGAHAAHAAHADAGVTVAQSPEDTPIVAFATANTAAAGVWLNWTRRYHRLGGAGGAHQAETVVFHADVLLHAGCWRPGVQWMQKRYPPFFEPDPAAAATAQRVYGTASYADSRGAGDMGPAAAAHYKRMGYMMNWDSTARFPWHGEYVKKKSGRCNPGCWMGFF